MGKTNIAWCTHSLNFIKWFCTRASPGCVNCYMLALAERYPQNAADRPVWRSNALKELKKLPPGAEVFVGDMYDVFHERMPLRYIHWHFNLVAQRPDCTFLFLTKRIERAYYLAPFLPWAKNIWLGTSVENADWAWRIEWLKRIPARHKFVSFEPLIGYVGDIDLTGIDQAITGGESGALRRPFYPSFAAQIRDICQRDGVHYFHKQGGHRYPGMDRLLDGVLHDELAWRERSAAL